MPQTTVPARTTPASTGRGTEVTGTLEGTTPHRYANMGRNHVIGLIRVNAALGHGRWRRAGISYVTLIGVN